MENNTRYAEIPRIKKGVAFSDPSYDGSVWCQYRKEFQASNWAMKMATRRDADNYIDIELQVGRKTVLSGLSTVDRGGGEFSVLHYAHYDIQQHEIGIDTARVFAGELENFENFGEAASVYTAADGLFGELWEFTSKGEGEPAGFLLMGSVDGAIANEDDLFLTVMSAFDGNEISKERYEWITDGSSLDLRKSLAREINRANALERAEKHEPSKSKNDLER